MKKQHLLILTPGFPADETDSTTVPHIQDWLKEAKTFFEIKVISFQYPFEKRNYVWENIAVFSAGGKNRAFPFRFLTWYHVWQKINIWHHQKPFDLVLCFWLTETALLGEFFVKRNPNISLFRWALGQDVKKENRYLAYLDLNYGTLLSLSEYIAKYLATKSHILPFGLPKVAFIPSNNRKIDIIGIGSHIPLKRYDFFIDLISKLKTKYPDIQCLLIGEGKETHHLQSQVKALDLDKNIQFISKVPRQTVFEYLGKSKILLHPSIYEGQGMVLGEALQMGCYVICSKVGYLVQHPKMNICDKDEDFLPALNKVMKLQNPDFQGVKIGDMEQSVKGFLSILHHLNK